MDGHLIRSLALYKDPSGDIFPPMSGKVQINHEEPRGGPVRPLVKSMVQGKRPERQ